MSLLEPGLDLSECDAPPVRLVRSAVQTARTYLNQLDNRRVGVGRHSSKVPGNAQCAATSLTMSLLSLYDGDRDALFSECVALARAQGTPLTDVTSEAVEVAVMELMIGTDWDRAPRVAPGFFEDAQWRPATHGGNRVIKNPFAQAYTASRFSRCGDAGVSIVSEHACIERGTRRAAGGLDLAGRWSWAQQMWQAGAEVSFEAAFTGGGHVVHVLEISAQEAIVHDPFGMWLGRAGYIQNGKVPGKLGQAALARFRARARRNAVLVERRDQKQAYTRWGERNSIAKSELFDIRGPKWVLAIGVGADAFA